MAELEKIQGFGDNGELSQGAALALEKFLESRIRPELNVSNVYGVPIFPTLDEARDFEETHPGRLALWWASGIQPPVSLVDEFDVVSPDLYATEVSGKPWFKALMVGLGTPEGIMTARTLAGGYATQGTTGNGAGAGLTTDGILDLDVEIEYNNIDGASARQSRVWARGNPAWTTDDRSQMSIQAIVRSNGEVLYEPWFNPATESYQQFMLGPAGTAPVNGKLRLRVQGDKASVFVNDTQVGATRTLEGPQLSGAHCGFGMYLIPQINRFEATELL